MSLQFDPRDSKIMQWVRGHRTPNEPRFDADAAWSRFQRERGLGSGKRPRRIVPPAVWRIAAALLIVAGGSGLYWRSTHSVVAPVALTERVAANGERPTVTLGDGTRITLNGGSRLRYPAEASRGDRDVYLEGEAFFEVPHDPSRAFRVHAGNALVRDIGTKFSVTAYAGQAKVDVVVTEGVVALSRDSAAAPQLELKAGDGATLAEGGAPLRMTPAMLESSVAWTNGALVFDQITVRDAAARLERWYGVRVNIADSALASRKVNARFHGERIDQVLDAITLALGARYQRDASTYTLSSR
jgi:transmembrane sensor